MLHLKDIFSNLVQIQLLKCLIKQTIKKYKLLLILVSVKHKESYCWMLVFTQSILWRKKCQQPIHNIEIQWNLTNHRRPLLTNCPSLLLLVFFMIGGRHSLPRKALISMQSYVQIDVYFLLQEPNSWLQWFVGAVNKKKLYSVIYVFFFHFSSKFFLEKI